MKFSIKKNISVILSLSSFLSSVNVRSFDNYETSVIDVSAKHIDCLDVYESIEEQYARMLASYRSNKKQRDLFTTTVSSSKMLLYAIIACKLGRIFASYLPDVHWTNAEKTSPIRNLQDPTVKKYGKSVGVLAQDGTLGWIEIKNLYETIFCKHIDDKCTSEKELAWALTQDDCPGFFRSVNAPWAPLGLHGPVYARSECHVIKENPDMLPYDCEELVNIGEKLRNYVASVLSRFYNDTRDKRNSENVVALLEKLLTALSTKNFSVVSKELNSVLQLIENLLPVLHLFYSISDSSISGNLLKGALGFAPRVPIIRKNEKGEDVLTTSDYLKSWGDCKGTVEINLTTNAVEKTLGLNRFKLVNMLLNSEKMQDLASGIYSYFDAKKENVYSSLFKNLKEVIALVHKLLKEQKDLISTLFQTVNRDVLPEIEKQENYITLLFELEPRLKELFLDKNDIKKEIDKKKQKKGGSDLTDEEKKLVIKNMKIKKINKALLTDKIKKQLPDLPVFREIGEFFIDKFFDELDFVYE